VVARAESILRRGYHSREREHPAHKTPRASCTEACPECGSPVRPGRRFCSQACYAVWWKAHVQRRFSSQGSATLARLRDQGRDPSHGGEAARKRAASVSRAKRGEWLALSRDERRRRTRPATLARCRPPPNALVRPLESSRKPEKSVRKFYDRPTCYAKRFSQTKQKGFIRALSKLPYWKCISARY
jgi:hypothetical protein